MSTAAPDPRSAHAEPESPSLGTLLSTITRDFSTLFRQEVALAKAEVTASATKAGLAVGMLVGALIAVFFVLLFISIALMWALAPGVSLPWAALIVMLLWAIIAIVLGAIARTELKKIRGLPQTAETLREIPPTLKPGGTA